MQNSSLLGLLLLSAALALYSIRVRGNLYSAFLTGGLLAVAFSVFFSFSISIGWIVQAGLPWTAWVLALMVPFVVQSIGVWLMLMLVNGWRVPPRLAYLLPVRGIHARRLLAAGALFAIAGPTVGSVSFFLGATALPDAPFIGTGFAFLGFVACLAPIWNHLVTD